jgi:dTMP kinase
MTAIGGLLITFEGPDGGGKTTQLRKTSEWLTELGVEYLVTREPGGTQIGEQIRDVIHDPKNKEMYPTTELMLYAASRAQITRQVIKPALDSGMVVMVDRFIDSSVAYQAYGRGLPIDDIHMLNGLSTKGLTPDLTLLLDVDPETGIIRRTLGGVELNRLDLEAIAFHERVRKGYLDMVGNDVSGRWRVIDAGRPVDEVWIDVRNTVEGALIGRGFIERPMFGKERFG